MNELSIGQKLLGGIGLVLILVLLYVVYNNEPMSYAWAAGLGLAACALLWDKAEEWTSYDKIGDSSKHSGGHGDEDYDGGATKKKGEKSKKPKPTTTKGIAKKAAKKAVKKQQAKKAAKKAATK